MEGYEGGIFIKVLPKTNTKNPNFESMDELRKF